MTISSPTDLPNVATGAVFVDHLDLAGKPSVVVDGPRIPGCVLTLSHWRSAATPPDLAADTSTEIVDRYLRLRHRGLAVTAVTNNHYDEDGILGLWMLLERPSVNDSRRALAVAAAQAGDFRSWVDPDAPKVALALAALAERPTTPFPDVLRALSSPSGRDPAGAICAAVLPRVGPLLGDPERYARFWRPRWSAVDDDIELIDSGAVSIQEWPAVDLAVVQTPRPLDPLAIYPRTPCSRVLTVTGDTIVFQDRYESWVKFVSRRVPERIDLGRLADRFNQRDPIPGGSWRYEGVSAITPRLLKSGPGGLGVPTGLDVSWIVEQLVATYTLTSAGPEGPGYDRSVPKDLSA